MSTYHDPHDVSSSVVLDGCMSIDAASIFRKKLANGYDPWAAMVWGLAP